MRVFHVSSGFLACWVGQSCVGCGVLQVTVGDTQLPMFWVEMRRTGKERSFGSLWFTRYQLGEYPQHTASRTDRVY